MYTVRPGDNLSKIAQRYGVPVRKLIAANPRLRLEGVQPGQGLSIPGHRDAFEVAPPALPQSLQRGTTGAAVLGVQKKLVAKGFLSPASLSTGRGIFGPRTEAAVRAFQKARGLPETGVAGSRTLAALSAADARAVSEPDEFEAVTQT